MSNLKIVERFLSYVDRRNGPLLPRMETPCWTWTGGRAHGGYGQMWVGKTMVKAHRLAWILAYGEIPKGEGYHGTCVRHKCDNRLCVRPSHLELGSNADNLRDMVERGRSARGDKNGSRTKPECIPRGDKNGSAKLTAEQVVEIRAIYRAGGTTQRQLAERFGVSRPQISLVVRGKTWSHIPGAWIKPSDTDPAFLP